MVGGGTQGTPWPDLDGGGYPIPGVGGTPTLGWGVPQPGLDSGGGYLGYPLTHQTEQHSEHLLRGGRYASCVHAGGLSCSSFYFSSKPFLYY